MLSDSALGQIMTWSDNGDAVMIWSEENLGRVLPNYGFKTNNFTAIQRQLNYYGFRKATQGKNPTVYTHEYFYRGSQYLHEIKKRTATRTSKVVTVVDKSKTQRLTRSSIKTNPDTSLILQESVDLTDLIAFPNDDVTEVVESLSNTPEVYSDIVPSFAQLPQDNFESKRISEENRMLREEMTQLRSQQEATQMMLREILVQLQRSKEETDSLKNLVYNLTQTQQQKEPSLVEILDIPQEVEGSIENLTTVDLSQFEMLQREWKLEDIQFDELIFNQN
jgi:hypothetical protein